MIYKKTVQGIFINRPNRFIANVLIDGKEEVVHVRNTGRCREILVSGASVILEDCSHIPNRKTRYSLIGVLKNDILINIDSQVPNTVVFDALNNNQIEGFDNLDLIKREYTYNKSRFDICFEKEDQKGFIEIKGVTLEENGVAMFPDAPTSRGAKHVLEMIDAVKEGYIGVIFFLVQMRGPHVFRPNLEMDASFSEAIALAEKSGVIILVYDSIVTEDGIRIGNQLNYEI